MHHVHKNRVCMCADDAEEASVGGKGARTTADTGPDIGAGPGGDTVEVVGAMDAMTVQAWSTEIFPSATRLRRLSGSCRNSKKMLKCAPHDV